MKKIQLVTKGEELKKLEPFFEEANKHKGKFIVLGQFYEDGRTPVFAFTPMKLLWYSICAVFRYILIGAFGYRTTEPIVKETEK